MKKFEWYPIYWNYVWIIVISWTIFILAFSASANWAVLKENRRIEAERLICQHQWERFNQKLDDGEIRIMLEREDLK